MTIAIGLRARNGVVLAADRKETYGTLVKVSADKIWSTLATAPREGTPFGLGDRSCITTGAGDGPYLDAMFARFRKIVSEGENLPDSEIERRLRIALKRFQRAYVEPLASCPDHIRPQFRLIVGIQFSESKLLASTDRLLEEVPGDYVAVGTGISMALPLLERYYYKPIPSVRTAVLIAAYVMYQTTQFVPECGKGMEILALANGRPFQVPSKTVLELSAAIANYDLCVEAPLLRDVVGESASPGDPDEAKARVAAIINGLDLG